MIRAIVSLMIILSNLTIAIESHAEASCVNCVEAFIKRGAIGFERDITSASRIYQLNVCNGNNKTVQIVCINWEAPYDGYIVMVDDKSELIDVKRVGYIKDVRYQELDKKYLVLNIIKGVGIGVRKDVYEIYTIENGLSNIWSNSSYEKEFPLSNDPTGNYEMFASLELYLDYTGRSILKYYKHTIKYKYISFDKPLETISENKEEIINVLPIVRTDNSQSKRP